MKTAIVTGASGNMGQAVVRKFLEEGYFVTGTVIPNDETILDFPSDTFEKVVVDLMNETDAQKFVTAVMSKHTKIDVAVLTVGGFAMGTIADTTTSDIKTQYELNFETAYNTARPVFLAMLHQNRGRIFLIGSRPGLNTSHGKGMVAYSLAKSLIFNLAGLMNDEAGSRNVVTSVIVPSTLDTPPNRRSMPDANFESWVKPEAIAEVIHWYCTEEASILREPVIKVYNKS